MRLLLLLTLCVAGCEDKGLFGDTAGGEAEPPAMNGITAAHNDVRSALGVPDLVWADDLAAAATAWSETLAADDCGFYHSSGGAYGENLFAGSPPGAYSPQQVVDAWAAEVQWYDYDSNSCSAPAGQSCGHYTQVVWADTQRVGCGMAVCPDGSWEIWTCNYDPPGNWAGEWPY